ncbi:uncharacterized protein LOC132273822 [Cornus florida]|uniref:uncharacterized protein LOC132273822 n=1 Tax=Cornus florida TaxID=4283 RepID=UPI0028978F52|nr:uncharacterized protein LOC132273822 [Cornus florida]
MVDRDQLANLIQETYRPTPRRVGRLTYRKPYPDYIDRYEFPRGYKVPNFVTFSGEDSTSTIEHIGQFTIQCGEVGANEFLKLRLFANSLTGITFSWYISLPANSVYTWQQLEEMFHTQFYKTEPDVSMTDLSRLSQMLGKMAEDFIGKFKRVRHKCQVSLLETEYMSLALNGLDFELRKKFEGMQFQDLFQLASSAARYEKVLKEEQDRRNASRGTYYRDPNYEIHMTEASNNYVKDPTYEIHLTEAEIGLEIDAAEINIKKPYSCSTLTKPAETVSSVQPPSSTAKRTLTEADKQYAFDITKADEIFDLMLADKIIGLSKGQKIPLKDELQKRDYCKWHNSYRHSTNNCIVFCSKLQNLIEKKLLRFLEKK